jgi:diaminopimelate decarboxylase
MKTDQNTKAYDIAGPLCFQGDFIAKDVPLPQVESGDILIIHDTGAYTFSLYSRYNSILPSAVYGFSR